MTDAMTSLGWFRADRRRRGRVVRWRHVDGWVLIPSFGSDRWALFDVHGGLVRTCTLSEAISHVQHLDTQPTEKTA